MKILVTGGAGFIGSNFIRYVLNTANDHAIINYDKLTYAGNLANLHSIADHPGYRFIKGDICDAATAEPTMPAVAHLSDQWSSLNCT
jgi:dTDP-glucose 4,6-dehydratase